MDVDLFISFANKWNIFTQNSSDSSRLREYPGFQIYHHVSDFWSNERKQSAL